ncbi:hypothetical protein [Halorubellus sp. PRR65]|uniref:hypothetical protein n=1 Tax=Halorubellus sp. PRR65 TaxID=3098148 RepID=UPI002B25DAC4|nr:hypothetical protein [Halorubellus sp. PRR65]
MSSQEIEDGISEMREHIDSLLSVLDAQMEESRLDEIVEGDGTLLSKNLGQKPERCIEDALIWPTLETLGFEYTPRPYYPVGDENECPDFRIDNLAARVIGENKSINNFAEAKGDIEEYLDSKRYEYGIATDGFRWAIYEVEADDHGRADLVDVVAEQDLTPAIRGIARDSGLVNYTEKIRSDESVDGVLGDFYQTLNHYGVRREIGGLSEFYDLYLEVLIGGGEYDKLELNLVGSLESPASATEDDELAFAGLFVDRLAYLQLLIDRGILEDVALHDQWSEHNHGLNRFRGSFYSQYLQPLFYDALAERPRSRDAELPESFQEVPHLAGGLFEPILHEERNYDIPDEVMKPVLTRFVEGEKRTLVNEAANGSLLKTYSEQFESRNVAGRIPEQYAAITNAYADEIDHVESQIERTLRSFEQSH